MIFGAGQGQGESETGRLEAFSDGVIAVIITIMALELKVPADKVDDFLKSLTVVDAVPCSVASSVSSLVSITASPFKALK